MAKKGLLNDAHGITITVAGITGLYMEEKEIKPPGHSTGGRINNTGHRNVAHRTNVPKKLKDTSDIEGTFMFNPAFLPQIMARIGVLDSFTVTWQDGQTEVVNGWFDEVEPSNMVEGEQALVDVVIGISNLDPTTMAEEGPAWTTTTTAA